MVRSTKTPISVLIPTKDEERNIVECIKSVLWAGEIFVYDSMSSDQTVEIAENLSAKVVQRQFDNFANHKNWALDNLPFKFDWILILDADERITPKLHEEICSVITVSNYTGYYIPRKNLFMGKWIRHGGWFPDYQLRLFRRGKARYEDRIVHERMVVDGKNGYLQCPLIHHDFKGLERYFDRHNTYSSMEAVEAFNILKNGRASAHLDKRLIGADPHRRRVLKEFAYRYFPCRPLIKFLWMYIIKLGFLDGRMGLRFCLLHTFYEYQISLKLEELSDTESPMCQKYKRNLKN